MVQIENDSSINMYQALKVNATCKRGRPNKTWDEVQ